MNSPRTVVFAGLLFAIFIVAGCGSSAPPTPTPIVGSSATLRVEAYLLPAGTVTRWDKGTYQLQVVLDNLTTNAQSVRIEAVISDSFVFVASSQEPKQLLSGNNLLVTQDEQLVPKLKDAPSHREVAFSFRQQPSILSGSYIVELVVTPATEAPMRIPVVVTVSDTYNFTVVKQPSSLDQPPSAPDEPAAPAPASACGDDALVYTVQRGDELREIAPKQNSTTKAILERNRDKIPDPDALKVGIELCIPKP